MSKVAVVTGSNKGIGFAIVKGLCQRFDGVVFLTSRDETRGKEAVTKLKEIGLNPEYHQLDVTDRSSVEKFRNHVKEKYGGIDILFNNAAVLDADVDSRTYEDAKKVIDINYRGILAMKEIIYPLIRNNGRIINISSDCGHLSNIRNEHWIQKLSKKDLSEADVNEFVDWYLESVKNGTFNREDIADGASVPSYRVAKVALSAVTMVHQRELESRNISINSMHPGLVRTDMTKGVGFYSMDEAAETPIYLALDAPQTLKGAYVWFDKKVLDWYDYKADYYFKVNSLNTN
ncbi:carbonyl reductase [NADPH] 1-like [Maniola hyperantus]|uniref:carbonyl reductase [NADPH] 1-like n=1 Tax=Aphantopus hyperantus TaxID=2795564 RepID=UPI00156832E3|nr:carbonyl reductase [NADPH] 1-like [Maniola hyperantus]